MMFFQYVLYVVFLYHNVIFHNIYVALCYIHSFIHISISVQPKFRHLTIKMNKLLTFHYLTRPQTSYLSESHTIISLSYNDHTLVFVRSLCSYSYWSNTKKINYFYLSSSASAFFLAYLCMEI